MPDKPNDDSTYELIPNPIILKLKAFDEQPGADGRPVKALALVGFLGNPNITDEYIDLYLQLDLSAFYRIAKTDILYVAPFPEDATEPVTVVVRSSAKIELVQTGEASFLTGSITSMSPLLPDNQGQGNGPARFPTITGVNCQTNTCPTTACPTQG